MARLSLIVLGVVFLGPLAAAFALAPPEVLALWPALLVELAPAVLGLAALVGFLAGQRLAPAPLAESAASWLSRRVARYGRDLTVAAMARGEPRDGSFYHPASRTIVLADDVHDEHTARAYATAAHELGHAVLHLERPWLSAVLRFARRHAGDGFLAGVGLLAGSAMVTGAGALRVVAAFLIIAAVVLRLLVLVDEAVASTLALRWLRDEPALTDHVGAARAHLIGALALYAAAAAVTAAPLLAWPWLVASLGEGRLTAAAPLTGLAATAATLAAVVCLIGALGALVHLLGLRSPALRELGVVPVVLAMPSAVLLTVLVAAQPVALARPWLVALAWVPAWHLLTLPFHLLVGRFARRLGGNLVSLPLPLEGATTLRLHRLTSRDLARTEADRPLIGLDTAVAWTAPLALLWLGWL